jgi:hypothetical protein
MTPPGPRLHFLHDGCVVAPDAHGGRGVFAARPIAAGETVSIWGGFVLTVEELLALPLDDRRYAVQVDEARYLFTPSHLADGADLINHSCAPNLGFDGPIALVALRDVAAGEELTYDYAMADATPLLDMDCGCGAERCRRRITSEDWRDPALQLAYRGRFSPHLERRIASDAAAFPASTVG